MLAAVCFLGGIAACRNSESVLSSRPVTLTIALPQGTTGSAAFGIHQIAAILSTEGLTAMSRDARPTPRLAESWETSPDKLSVRVRLKRGLRFHDRTIVDAHAVKRSLEATVREPQAVAGRPGLSDLEEITTEGDLDVVFKLRNPSSFFLDELEAPITKTDEKGQRIGTAAFRVVTSSKDEILLEATPAEGAEPPAVARIIIRAVPTLRTAWANLLRGEIDMVSEVPPDALEFVENDDVQTFSFLRNYMYVIAFNSTRQHLRNPVVRRALNLAIDRSRLIQTVLKGRGVPATGPVWPQHWAFDSSLAQMTHDASLAAALLDNVLPANRSRAGAPMRFSFGCLVPQNFALLERLALVVQKELYEVGVDMRLESVAFDEFNARIVSGRFDAAILDLIGGPSLVRAYQFWHSPARNTGANVFGYRNMEVDRWLNTIRHAADDNSLRAAAVQLQRAMSTDPPALFIAWNERTRAVSRRYELPNEPNRDVLFTIDQWRLASPPNSGAH